MAINPDHISTANFSSGAAQTVTSSTGNLSIVALWLNIGGAAVTSITDNKGNTYVPGITSNAHNIWYAAAAATGITSITVNFTGGGTAETVFYDCSGAHLTNPLVNADFVTGSATGSTPTINPVGPTSNYPYGGGIAISVIQSNGGVTTAVASPFTLDHGSNAGIAHATFASPGVFAPSWTVGSSGVWSGVLVLFASSTGTNNLRFAKGKSDAHLTALQTNQITIAAGDLAIIFLATDIGITATLSDGFANTYTPVTGMNPYVGTSGDYDIWAGFCVVSQTGQNAFSGSFTSDSGVCLYVIVITPATTPTINAHGVGTTSSANVNHIAATCSPAASDFLVSLVTGGNPYTSTGFTANGSWSLGVFETDSNFYESSAIEFQLSAAGGSTHDDMTTTSAVESNEVIFSFTISTPPPPPGNIYPNDMTPGTALIFEIS